MDVQWTQVDVERHAPIEVNDSHVVVEHQRSPVSSWFRPANHAPLDDVESTSASQQTVQGQDRPRPAAPGTESETIGMALVCRPPTGAGCGTVVAQVESSRTSLPVFSPRNSSSRVSGKSFTSPATTCSRDRS